MMKRIKILLIVFIVGIYACRPKPLEIDIQAAPPKLVVASQIVPETVLGVIVTRSFTALQHEIYNEGSKSVSQEFTNNIIVQNAFVTVKYAGITDTLFAVDTIPGLYVSAKTLQIPYQEYELNVYDPVLNESVSAKSSMLPAVKFDTVYPIVKGAKEINLKFSFKDFEGQNWYLLNVYKANNNSNIANLDVNSIPFSTGKNQLIQTQLINDVVYNTKNIDIELQLKDVTSADTIGVTIANISEGYYTFLQAQSKIDGIISQFFREPVNTPTNVQNGYGYFSAYDPDVKIIDIGKY